VHRTEAVSKSGSARLGEYAIRQACLVDSSETLRDGMVNYNPFVGCDLQIPMDWIPYDEWFPVLRINPCRNFDFALFG
jgi:hypothetical protein